MLRIFSILSISALQLLAHPHEELPVDASQKTRDALSHAKKITLSEGLPHPARETERFTAEVQRKDTRQIAGFPFYKPELKSDPATTDKLRRLITNPANLTAWTEKTGSGFHPDWSINWRRGWSREMALIALGGGEVIFISGDHQLRYHLTHSATKELKILLDPLKTKRP
jgi:hypothetical protein